MQYKKGKQQTDIFHDHTCENFQHDVSIYDFKKMYVRIIHHGQLRYIPDHKLK